MSGSGQVRASKLSPFTTLVKPISEVEKFYFQPDGKPTNYRHNIKSCLRWM